MSGAPFRLAPLDVAHDRARFNSGSEPLNRYLQHIDFQPTDVPVYANGVVSVTITRDNPADIVSCGSLLLGRQLSLGDTEHGVDIGIIDYSRKEADQFGVISVVERAFAKRMTARVVMPTDAVDDIHRNLAALRATPVLWIGSETFESLTVYGFYKEFSIDLAYPTVSYCSLTIEGLT